MPRKLTLVSLLTLSAACFADPIEVRNNHTFPVRMPYTMHDAAGKDTTVFVDVGAHATQKVDPAAPLEIKLLSIKPDGDGAAITFAGKPRGSLAFSVVLHNVAAADAKNDALSAGRPEKFKPEPLNLAFKKSKRETLFTTYSAETTHSGLRVRVELDCYPSGYLDVRTTVNNESAPVKNVYAAVLVHWKEPKAGTRIMDYNDEIRNLGEMTPWRKPGERHQYVARGLNWMLTYFDSGSALWINPFAPSFTVHHAATAKTPAQWVGANSPQLDQEAYVEGDTFTHVTELAHGSVKSYRGRLDDYVLPDKSQAMTFTHRLYFTNSVLADTDAANDYVAYTTYNPHTDKTLDLGTPSVVFGTAYFPYSTLGENFVTRKLPGMSQDSYWPLAADVVKNYKLFADDIRRDLRIAKAMGFETIRMHHLEMLWTNPADAVERSSGGSALSNDPALQITPEQRGAFLDFFFEELKHVGLTALVDVKVKPKDLGELVKKYHEQINGVEIDNEVLIFGIKDEDIPYWKECYAAVKAVDPKIRVHWTAHTNTGAFKRLTIEGVPHDRLGEHAYMDGESALTMARDFSLQTANYASTVNKPPVITEWNWRFLTRLTEENRAKVYAPIFENVLKARSMPEIQQFQFNDSLAMSPLSLKGIRHYELLNLSRRPKLEAEVFDRIVRTYSDPKGAFLTLETHYQSVTMDGPIRDSAVIKVSLKNAGERPVEVKASAEGPAGVEVKLETDANFTLQPEQTHTAQLAVTFQKDALPGFYHAFVRFESKDGMIAYAPVEIRRPGQPTFDTATHPNVAASGDAFSLDLTKATAVVYGDDCPIPELEAAWAVYQTLECATGRRVLIFTKKELPADGSVANVIYVGTAKALALNADVPAGLAITRLPGQSAIAITGPTSHDACLAAMDYTLRYWKTAKDAACRRVPLVERAIPKGGDAAQLP